MKYKDRKDAKRKYKQALLATVATMTLGVSTLGSTSSAFAEEKEKNVAPQKDDGTYYEDTKLNALAKFDTWTQDLGKTTGAANYKTTLGMAEKLLPTLYKDLKIGNFNNTARSFTMLSTALIPYGGAFISPIIGLLWPENNNTFAKDMDKMMESLYSMMDQKIENFDLSKLKQSKDALMITLKKFEDSVNNIPQSESYYDNIQNANVNYADIINTAFIKLIKECQTPGYEVAELPIFTILATAHLNFLHFMEKNAVNHPRIKMDPEHLSRYFTNELNKTNKEYVDYITKIYGEGRKQAYTKIPQQKGNFSEAMALWDNYKKFYESTLNSKAFWTAADVVSLNKDTTGWVQEGPNWYYLNKGVKKTGWFQDGEQWYYLSPEEKDGYKQGQMRTGWFQDGEQWYYLSPEEKDGYKQGQMRTGWFKDVTMETYDKEITQYGKLPVVNYMGAKEKWYYLSPKNNIKNSDSETFKQGQMVTGWFQVNGDNWYYSNPSDQLFGVRVIGDIRSYEKFSPEFNRGEVITDAYVKINNKVYSFNTNCQSNGKEVDSRLLDFFKITFR